MAKIILTEKIGNISPSQVDDNRVPLLDNKPIEVFRDGEKIIILNGNHRYYHFLKKEGADATVKICYTDNPYRI